jgi:c(7)-type cytochrome triheme protein
LAFDHAAHIKAEDMDCKDCHRFADKTPHATLPKLKDCADCHSEPQGKNPEEPKVREYLEAGKEIPWIVVNKLPGHVYFSHRAHVAFGQMKCWDCHRDMRKVSQPVSKPDIDYLSMSKCIACHKERKAEYACTTCHK